MSDPIVILYAPAKLKSQVWPLAGPYVGPMLRAGISAAGMTLEKLRAEIEDWDSDTDLWLAIDEPEMRLLGAAITTATVDERTSCLSVHGVSGVEFERWAARMYREMLALAQHRQCMALAYRGDPALSHFFPPNDASVGE